MGKPFKTSGGGDAQGSKPARAPIPDTRSRTMPADTPEQLIDDEELPWQPTVTSKTDGAGSSPAGRSSGLMSAPNRPQGDTPDPGRGKPFKLK